MEAFACSALYLVCQNATKWFELWTNGSKFHDTQMATHIHTHLMNEEEKINKFNDQKLHVPHWRF